MSKGVLEFNLPEEQQEFKMAQDAYKFQSILYDLDQQFLRPVTKHGVDPSLIKEMKDELHQYYPACPVPSDEQLDAVIHSVYEKVREKLYELIQDEGVDIV